MGACAKKKKEAASQECIVCSSPTRLDRLQKTWTAGKTTTTSKTTSKTKSKTKKKGSAGYAGKTSTEKENTKKKVLDRVTGIWAFVFLSLHVSEEQRVRFA